MNPIQELSGGTVDANMLDGLGVDEYFQRADLLGTWDYLDDALGSTLALADPTGYFLGAQAVRLVDAARRRTSIHGSDAALRIHSKEL